MYRKILVGYDGSEASRKAFDTACRLAALHGAELFVLTVARPPDIADDVETEAVIENSRRYHRHLLAELKPRWRRRRSPPIWRSGSATRPSRSSTMPTVTALI